MFVRRFGCCCCWLAGCDVAWEAEWRAFFGGVGWFERVRLAGGAEEEVADCDEEAGGSIGHVRLRWRDDVGRGLLAEPLLVDAAVVDAATGTGICEREGAAPGLRSYGVLEWRFLSAPVCGKGRLFLDLLLMALPLQNKIDLCFFVLEPQQKKSIALLGTWSTTSRCGWRQVGCWQVSSRQFSQSWWDWAFNPSCSAAACTWLRFYCWWTVRYQIILHKHTYRKMF